MRAAPNSSPSRKTRSATVSSCPRAFATFRRARVLTLGADRGEQRPGAVARIDVDEALDRQLAARIAEAERIAERRFDEVQHQPLFLPGAPAAARHPRPSLHPLTVLPLCPPHAGPRFYP